MENAGKMEEQTEEKQGVDLGQETLKSVECSEVIETENGSLKSEKKSKLKEGKSVLIKQEERETGVVSLKVLARQKFSYYMSVKFIVVFSPS
ncbi:putative ABC transporter C family member 1 [Cocos nucifera]|nr:putative ABC transporter C family member 1 [Cocos nucifera]